MKEILFIFWGILMPVVLYGQGFAVSAEKMNVVYIGVDNPLTIVAEGYKCDQLEVSCESGTIRKTENCEYNIAPVREGAIEIEVKARTSSGVKQIGTKKFRVKLIPSPTARIAGRSSGLILAAIFKVQLGVSTFIDGFDFESRFRVARFKVEFFREQKLLYSCVTAGPYFDKPTRDQMNKLKPGDHVSVTDIKAVGPDARERTLNNIELTLN
jgi:hypothetical protein